jgi:hypothetical protein
VGYVECSKANGFDAEYTLLSACDAQVADDADEAFESEAS